MWAERISAILSRCTEKRRMAEGGGGAQQSGIATNFPKNPPPPGIAYSQNFARFQKAGRFAEQRKD